MATRSTSSQYQPSPPNYRLNGYKGSTPRRCAIKTDGSPANVKINASSALPGRGSHNTSVKVS